MKISKILSVLYNYFTTSSYPGQIILIDGESDNTDVQKQNCSWLFVTHQKCQKDDVLSGLRKACGDAVFKCEPFVLHVQLLYSVAVNSGFRNSGITVGKIGNLEWLGFEDCACSIVVCWLQWVQVKLLTKAEWRKPKLNPCTLEEEKVDKKN